jgi:dolichyl-phosphate-mannose--protein O-mannosyl transferase
VWAWVRRLDWRAGFVVVAVLIQYLAWFPVWDRVQFFFYLLPVTPFLVLAAVYVLRDMSEYRIVGGRSRPLLPVVVGFVVLCVGLFAFFYPVLTGWHLSYDAWHVRMWMKGWI